MKPATRKSKSKGKRPDLSKLDEKERAELLALMEEESRHWIILLHRIPRPADQLQPEIDPESGCFIQRIYSIDPVF